MTDLTPAQELRAAAETLRDLARAAADFHPTPWQAGQQTVTKIRAFDANRASLAHVGAGRDRSAWLDPETAHYIVALHPGVGAALANWLEQAADAFDGMPLPDDEPCLAVARAILGEVTLS